MPSPLIVGTGVATAEEIGIDTFEQRLTDESKTNAVFAFPAAQRVGDNQPGVGVLAIGSPGQL